MRTLTIHYPFGMLMPERSYSSPAYRYGFNGKEKMEVITGLENDYDLGERFFDSRLGRMLSIDPLQYKYPSQTPYAYCYNSPISKIDLLGLSGTPEKDDKGNSTGKIQATFVFIKQPGVTQAQFDAYCAYFVNNLTANMSGSNTANNEAGQNVNIIGNFTYDTANKGEESDYANAPNVNFIYVNPDNGQRSNAVKGGNSAQMNVGDIRTANNIPFHEVLHLFGLSDRYQFYQKLNTNPKFNGNGSNYISAGYETFPVSLSKAEDLDYQGNEDANVMANANNNTVTQFQWLTIFQGKLEPDYGNTTFFGTAASYLSQPYYTPLRIINDKAIYYKGFDAVNKTSQILYWYSPEVKNEAGSNHYNKSVEKGCTNYASPHTGG